MNLNNLIKISKPARYIGGELNSFIKDDEGLLKFCLIFPDIYEIGSSHIGFRLLYEKVNNSDKIYCERFFAPWVDVLEVLGNEAFVSLEKKRPLKEFDVLGFSMHYELCYTTVLAIIKRSGINLLAKNRTEDEPIIIGGGSCAYNPSSMADFFDAFFIGEGDIGLRTILEEIKELKNQGKSRQNILKHLHTKSFMFVPQVDNKKTVKRLIHHTFSTDEGTIKPILPLMPAVQDRVAVEIARGCTAGCRFCQAGIIYRPVRERNVDLIINEACSHIQNTGHMEVSLLSLSTGDYSELEPLVLGLNRRLEPLNVSLSTPSLRADSVSSELFEEVSKVRSSGFTIAPEAATERMRKIINKNLTEDDILKAIRTASDTGYRGVKLYFMIGLPYETDEDIMAIVDLATKIKYSAKRGFDISISVSHFVPKPHTPFQRFGQVHKLELERRMYMLKDELKRRKFKVRFHDTRVSTVEALLSRGGSDLSKLMQHIAEKEFYLDAWGDFFDYQSWFDACAEVGIDLEKYATKSYESGEHLPWGNIDIGVTDEFYENELEKCKNLEETEDCRRGTCSNCGVCDFDKIKPINATNQPLESFDNSPHKAIYKKYEVVYKKINEAKFLSALELSRVFYHSLTVAGVRLKYSEGYNPMPKVVLYLPLPVGIEGCSERVVFEAEEIEKNIMKDKLQSVLPQGLELREIKDAKTLKISSDFLSSYKLGEIVNSKLKEALNNNEISYERVAKSGEIKEVSLNYYMESYDDNIITLKVDNSGGFNLVEFFKKCGVPPEDIEIMRLSVESR